ncbi:hypothetical protein C7C46_31885 [Streptomyces tateyamensis]|uniref:Uncharacterized protein n=1 Tax=Streptomyces tateyamensis TaxID=565073 RepID=A0A2V4NXC8_9ACTN|nr:hypothetical protein [Streptomyces tateyamensis]PYC66043.1 hypothetical protein C7C46_31885 [Streptomyces tateyamensis]
MTTQQHPTADLPIVSATILATALGAALTADDRFAEAHRAAQHAVPKTTSQPGHLELLRRECAYRLAQAAQLAPRGLLAPNLGLALQTRDRAWPRPIRRAALLTATTHLASVPDPALLAPASRPKAPLVSSEQLTTALHTAARQAAMDLRSGRCRTVADALTIATRGISSTLPVGYDHFLEREMTLRLALTLALPAPGALAPGLDFALDHATRSATRTELADLVLTALRPSRARTVASLGRIPLQRTLAATGSCGCDCANGGFCGGCGHAGCGRD